MPLDHHGLEYKLAPAHRRAVLDRRVYGGRVKPPEQQTLRNCWPCWKCGDTHGPGDWMNVTCPTIQSGAHEMPRKHVAVGAPQPTFGLAPLAAHDSSSIWLSPRGGRTGYVHLTGAALRDEAREAREALKVEEAEWLQAEERAKLARERLAAVEARITALKEEPRMVAAASLARAQSAEPAEKPKPKRPWWLARKPDWVKKGPVLPGGGAALRLPNGQLAKDFGDGVLGYQTKDGTYNFVKDHRKPKAPPPPSSSASTRASSRGSRHRPSSAPALRPASSAPTWPISERALALDERLKDLERRAALSSDAGSDCDRLGRPRAHLRSCKLYHGGASWEPGANSRVNLLSG